jgi:hypothetical protein
LSSREEVRTITGRWQVRLLILICFNTSKPFRKGNFRSNRIRVGSSAVSRPAKFPQPKR